MGECDGCVVAVFDGCWFWSCYMDCVLVLAVLGNIGITGMDKLCKKFIKRWGVTKRYDYASWIAPDGSLVGTICDPTHEDMITRVSPGMIFSEFICGTGFVRCSIFECMDGLLQYLMVVGFGLVIWIVYWCWRYWDNGKLIRLGIYLKR